jgi:hypothetical protein
MERHLLLDIDGVLNPWRARHLHGDWSKRNVGNIKVWRSLWMGRWLCDLEQHDVTVTWATTWVHHPAELEQLESMFGLPGTWPRLDIDPVDLREPGESGKRNAVAAKLASTSRNARVVWVDDELGPRDLAFAAEHNITAVRPDPGAGLAAAVMRQRIVAGLDLPAGTLSTLGVRTFGL